MAASGWNHDMWNVYEMLSRKKFNKSPSNWFLFQFSRVSDLQMSFYHANLFAVLKFIFFTLPPVNKHQVLQWEAWNDTLSQRQHWKLIFNHPLAKTIWSDQSSTGNSFTHFSRRKFIDLQTFQDAVGFIMGFANRLRGIWKILIVLSISISLKIAGSFLNLVIFKTRSWK